METTAGQILLNELLPEDMRDYNRVLDKKSIAAVFEELAEKHPDRYSDISHRFHTLSSQVVTSHGGQASLSLDSFKTPETVKALHSKITENIHTALAGPGTQEEKNTKIVKILSDAIDPVTKANYEAALKENNPLGLQVLSGSRGNEHQLRGLRGGSLLFVDHKDRPIPIPILASFSEGLDPVQYWSGAYGARKGSIATKFSTPRSGFLGKQLGLAVHRLIVTEKDCGTASGIPIQASDPDNEGAVLAMDNGPFTAGTVLTPKHLKELGQTKIIIRSPVTCQARHGICQRCAGVRERGGFPPLGDNIGAAASQAVSEVLAQAQLSTKHGGGVAGAQGSAAKHGLDLVEQLVQVPDTFAGAAAIAQTDGRVEQVEPAPQGGQYVYIAKQQHWVAPDLKLTVKKGDTVEAGDLLSEGLPNPADIVKHKGIGEGRRYFTEVFRDTLNREGFKTHRRNVELLARGLVNHVQITDLDGPADTVPDDIVEFDSLSRGYQPRFGFKTVAPKQGVGLYLEEPAVHFSIGTRVTPKVAKTLEEFKIPAIKAHADPPPFVPEMVRAMETTSYSPDWMVRLGGFYLKRGLTEAAHRGRKSELHGTSFIPSLAKGTEFGKPPEGMVGY